MAKRGYRDGRRNNRPPVEHQFKPGKSGNGKGRPPKKPPPPMIEHVSRQLNAKHTVMLDGHQTELPFKELITMRLFALALKGNARAVMWAMDLIERVEQFEAKRARKAESHSSRLTAEQIANMTEDERTEAYFKAIREAHGENYKDYYED
jgi:hypothetical protein